MNTLSTAPSDKRYPPSHQTKTLSKITSSIYLHQGDQVYLLDTYTKMGRRIALVMEVEHEDAMYEVFYDQLDAS
ncbi:MAG: hypothetical protein AB7S65_06790 [Sulfuricurvum sp.]